MLLLFDLIFVLTMDLCVLTSMPTGFGTNTTSAFGAAKPAFGSTTTSGGGLFGGGTTATIGGGFGSGGFGTNNASTGFGTSGASGGALFGQSKPAGTFGGTGGSIFGGGTTTTGGNTFGSTNNNAAGSLFGGGGGIGTALGGNVPEATGTAAPPFQPFTDKDATTTNNYLSISAMPSYGKYSFDVRQIENHRKFR